MGKSALINYTKAKLSHLNFKIYQSFNLLSRVVGGSEQMVKKIFKEAVESQPCVLVFEDLHLLFSKNKV
jgi:SpoVK/Ycf46/Vps4 family AAA+-type ATPase